MAYKDKPLSNFVNKVYFYFSYNDTNGNYQTYENNLDVIIETHGDLSDRYSLVLKFKFTIPSDFPTSDNISNISNITLYFYHTDETSVNYYGFQVQTKDDVLVFGQKLAPNQEVSLTFIVPMLSFQIFDTFISNV